ncbi:FG-GAP repeat domain-containing protein, partial [Limnofasciculus baicalensis]
MKKLSSLVLAALFFVSTFLCITTAALANPTDDYLKNEKLSGQFSVPVKLDAGVRFTNRTNQSIPETFTTLGKWAASNDIVNLSPNGIETNTITFPPHKGLTFVANETTGTNNDNSDGIIVKWSAPARVSASVPVSYATAINFPAGIDADCVAIGDFNGDSKLDLAVTNWFDNNVSVLLGNGNGSFGAATNFPVGTNPVFVVTGDVNGDGKLDLAVANFSSNNVSVLLGNGNGSFGAATNFPVGTNPYSVAIGDVNGDSQLDLAFTNWLSNKVSVLLGNGNGSFG